jgi:oxalate decarboxylase/phosphoglucose isomerase-like protein (cupin superfamily)
MQIRPGDASDEEVSNDHPRCEQWLYVASGTGSVTVIPKQGRRRHIKLCRDRCVIIERGVRNTGRKLLSTVNFYIPPAYRKNGDLLPAARR